MAYEIANSRRPIGFNIEPISRSATERLEAIKERRESNISAVSYPIVLGADDLYFDYSEWKKLTKEEVAK